MELAEVGDFTRTVEGMVGGAFLVNATPLGKVIIEVSRVGNPACEGSQKRSGFRCVCCGHQG